VMVSDPLVSDGSPSMVLTGQVNVIRRLSLSICTLDSLETPAALVTRYGARVKHLHYGSIVIAISDQLATTFNDAAHDFMQAGRSAVWPVSGYRDDRDEVSIQLAIGPGIPFAITDTWIPDERPPARHDSSSIAYIQSEQESLEKEQADED